MPARIEHQVDRGIRQPGNIVEFHYNYFDYHFEVDAGEIRARAYFDEMSSVSIYLPTGMTLEHPDAGRVLHYLARRFQKIKMLGPAGYVEIPLEQDPSTTIRAF